MVEFDNINFDDDTDMKPTYPAEGYLYLDLEPDLPQEIVDILVRMYYMSLESTNNIYKQDALKSLSNHPYLSSISKNFLKNMELDLAFSSKYYHFHGDYDGLKIRTKLNRELPEDRSISEYKRAEAEEWNKLLPVEKRATEYFCFLCNTYDPDSQIDAIHVRFNFSLKDGYKNEMTILFDLLKPYILKENYTEKSILGEVHIERLCDITFRCPE